MVARPESRDIPTGAGLTIGLALALFTSILPDAVLLPAVDRAAPRSVGLAVVCILISAGWWIATGRTGRTYGSRAILALTGLALAGGFTTAALLPWWREIAALGLRGHWRLPYYPNLALVVAGCVLPVALPFGALAGVLTGDERRRAWTPLLIGLGAGWASGPWLAQVLLGPGRLLQIAALLAGTAGVLLAERGAIAVRCIRFPRGAAPALMLLGVATLVAGRELGVVLDRGALPAPFLATCIVLVAAIAVHLPHRGLPWFCTPLLLAAAATFCVCFVPAEFAVARAVSRDGLRDAARVFGVALAPGLALGLLLRSNGTGMRLSLAPAALALLVPLVTWYLLPTLGPRTLVAALAIPVVLALLPQRPVPIGGLALLCLTAFFVAVGVGPPTRASGVRALREMRSSEGQALEVRDPGTGATLVAIDGRASFGRSAGQQRRFAHVPILLNGPARSILVVDSGSSETAYAACMHAPALLHWLRPFSVPESWAPRAWPGSDPPTDGSERQFLAVDRGRYDVIVLAPDPRADRRMALTGTVEYFELARSRLEETGTLCQWYDLADVHITDLRAVMASALHVFPYAYVVADHARTRRACIGLVLRNLPLSVWPTNVDAILRDHADVRADFESIGEDGLGIACSVFADRGLIELVAPSEAALHDERTMIGARGALCGDDAFERMRLGLDFIARYRREPTPWIKFEPGEAVRMSAAIRERFKNWQHELDETRASVHAHGFASEP